MNTLDSIFATDEILENEGIEIPVGLNAEEKTVSLLIGALGNPKHEKALSRYEKYIRATRKSPER